MKRILIIEDDTLVADIYRDRFTSEGFKVEVAVDGIAGLESIEKFRPDAVILDLLLPKLSGVDLLKRVRAKPEFEKLPIIVFSNTYMTDLIQAAWKAGATKCLSKASCSPKYLISVLRSSFQEAAPAAVNPAPVHANGDSNGAHGKKHETNGHAVGVTGANQALSQSPAELKRAFYENASAMLVVVRQSLQSCIKAQSEQERLPHLQEIYSRVHTLASTAGIAGLIRVAQLGDALEALIKELQAKPASVNPSTLRTCAAAIDFLGTLFNRGAEEEAQDLAPVSILVVDDEPISRRAVTAALEKARLKAIGVESPHLAFELISENAFDLIFLDVDMPGMTGFELCSKLRSLNSHKHTPVIFVTGLNDFESRANSTMSGGNDFIAKPFLFIELAVKALVHVLRGRLQPLRAPVPA